MMNETIGAFVEDRVISLQDMTLFALVDDEQNFEGKNKNGTYLNVSDFEMNAYTLMHLADNLIENRFNSHADYLMVYNYGMRGEEVFELHQDEVEALIKKRMSLKNAFTPMLLGLSFIGRQTGHSHWFVTEHNGHLYPLTANETTSTKKNKKEEKVEVTYTTDIPDREYAQFSFNFKDCA